MKKIKITAKDILAFAELNETPTAQAIWQALPIHAKANTWGDEIYFSIPVKREQDSDARDVVEMGELGYWSPGNAFCIFFGRTPASRGNEIRAASAVNVIGRVIGDATIFKRVRSGTTIVIERADD